MQSEGALVGQFRHLGRHLHGDHAAGQDHRGKAEAHAEGLEFHRGAAGDVHAGGHGIFAAGQELGGFAGNRGQVGLGQGAHQADLLKGLDRGAGLVQARAAGGAGHRGGLEIGRHAAVAGDELNLGVGRIGQHRLGLGVQIIAAGQPAQQGAVDAIGGGVGEGILRNAGLAHEGVQVEAELLDDAALHLHDAHLEHHLLLAGDGQHVDHLLGLGHEPLGQAHSLFGIAGIGHAAGEDHRIVERFHPDGRAGQQSRQGVVQGAGVLFHPDVQAENAPPGGVEEGRVGLARAHAHDIDAARRAQDRVGHGWIGHQHVARIDRQLDNGRLAARQGQGLAGAAGSRQVDPHHAAVALDRSARQIRTDLTIAHGRPDDAGAHARQAAGDMDALAQAAPHRATLTSLICPAR